MPAPTGNLVPIDWVIVLAYVVGMQVVGLFYVRYVHSAKDLLLAGRMLPFWAIGVSIVASDIGAIDLISGSGTAYQVGIAQANFDWLGSVPAILVAAFIFVPYYWRAGVFTIPEFLGRRYNGGVQVMHALFWLVFMAANISIMLLMSSKVLNTILGWDFWTSIAVTAALVGVYTVTGGLAAIVMTDVMQVVVMFVGAGALLVLSLWEAGGPIEMVDRVMAQGPAVRDFFRLLVPHGSDSPYSWPGIVFGLGLILSTGYFVANQAVLQRALAARSEWDAKAGMIVAGFLKLLIPVLMFFPGLCARALYPDLDDADTAVPVLVRELMPAGLIGLMFAAFFAALMSSIDSYLNSWVTVFISDIYLRVVAAVKQRRPSDRHLLILGRTLTAGILVAGGLCAPLFDQFATIYLAIQSMLTIVNPPTLAILLLGIFWRRTTGWGGLAGLVLGVTCATTLLLLDRAVFLAESPFLFVAIWSFLLTLVVTVAVSLCTQPEPLDRLRGLVYGLVVHDAEAQAALRKRVDGL